MIRLKTFGTPVLQRDDGPLGPGASQRRRLALLAVLAAAGEKAVSRDKLLAYLWPDAGEDQARHTLAQTLYLLRRDSPGGEVVLGTSELRLNPEVIQADVAEFRAALAAGDVERAGSVYAGPFLDGFYLSDATEFERWSETERGHFAKQARTAFEGAARDAVARGDMHRAADWWRRVVAADPLDARAAAGLMEALAAVGDRSGALQHARVHEALVRAELDAPPDPAVTAIAERLKWPRADGNAPAARNAQAAGSSPAEGRAPSEAPAETAAGTSAEAPARGEAGVPAVEANLPRATRRWGIRSVAAAGASLLLLAAVGAQLMRARRADATAPAKQVFAIGAVRDYSGVDSSGIARALTDMLATNLARVPDLRVVSNARIYEIVGVSGSEVGRDLAARLSAAAKQAGATEIVEGAMYRYRPGTLRFDLRRVDLASGAIRKAYSVEGADPFELVDRATAEVVADVGSASTGTLHVADVTTRSLVAYRFYEEGLRAYYQQNDVRGARRLFLAAAAEDSTFAMAEYYAAQCELVLSTGTPYDRLVHAARLADRATDRERLLVRGTAAQDLGEPSNLAIAETLATRYPAEPDGHFLLGQALMWSGDFLGAVPHLRRVVEMDSLSLRGSTERCRACDALSTIAIAYWLADSLAAAERVAREWVRSQPLAPAAQRALAGILSYQGRYEDARAASRESGRLLAGGVDPMFDVLIAMRRGTFAEADSILGRALREDSASETRWLLTMSLRYQGRLREALAVGHENRPGVAEAIVLFDMGRNREAAAMFAALAAAPTFRPEFRSRTARDRVWNLTHEATALAAAGDSAVLTRLADSIQHVGAQSAYGRDQLLHHYVRGLVLRARAQLPAAADEFSRGIFSSTDGYTRDSYELARTLLALHRAREAITVLQPAFRGSLQGSNSYVTFTELHEALAEAFDAAAQPDSAAAHYRYVVDAWAHADTLFRARWERARARLAVLGHGN